MHKPRVKRGGGEETAFAVLREYHYTLHEMEQLVEATSTQVSDSILHGVTEMFQ